MVVCDNCGRKIGFFEKKYDYIDDDGKPLIYCYDCNKEFEEKEKEKERKKQERLRKEKLKKIFEKNAKWEYKILNLWTIGSRGNATGNKIKEEYEEELNKLGQLGWELVSAVPMDSIAPRIGISGTATEWVSCIFKRKL